MHRDLRDMPVTAATGATVSGINDFIEGLLGYANKAEAILAAADQDPDSPLANAYAAMYCMFLESPEAPVHAAGYIERASTASKRGNERERMVVEAAKAWAVHDIPRAIEVGEQLATHYPRELATAKVSQYHHFNLGDAPGMLRISHEIAAANADVPAVHGMAAFAYEQAHLLEDAERAARHAIELQRKEPWAHHALAHVFLTQGRTHEAREFLEDVKETWTDLNSFMFTHNYWHLALVRIDQGDTDDILSFYDQNVWGVCKEYSQDQVGAVSLLARLELAGIDVGPRWNDLGKHLQSRIHDHVQPFLNVQYLYGLARAGLPEADAMLANLRGFAAHAPSHCRSTWVDVALPTCKALLAHARGDYETSFEALGSVLPRLVELGGSHAQRDLFEQIWLDTLIRTGRMALAQRTLEQRRAASPQARPAYEKLAWVYDRLALPAESRRVYARAPAERRPAA